MAEEEKQQEEKSPKELMEQLAGASRRGRQEASRQLADIAKDDPGALAEYTDDLVDALDRPEAQTRWQVLEVLTCIAKVDPQRVAAAFDGAETSLFDEDSAIVRLAAFKFLAAVGATSEQASEHAWPLLDEAVQCYHGDPEYRDMLTALLDFAKGTISDRVRDALVARCSFDAENGHGYVKAFSQEIIEATK